MQKFETECGPKCRSRQHASQFNAAITNGNLQEIQVYSRLCYNSAQLSDTLGRSALHVAAACGKTDIVDWLLMEKGGDTTYKDIESGWTALHRSLFYGQLATARLLIQHSSDLYTRDHEGLGPLDIVMKDRPKPGMSLHSPKHQEFSDADPSEVYSWGDNSNFTLGHVTEQRKSGPEVVDEFRKLNVSVKEVVMCKYHTVFLSQMGQVYTCGHGLGGGRLGHGDEATCLVPKLVSSLQQEVCVQVAASRDHTVMFMQGGSVYSCGLNDNHQLGQFPTPDKCLLPKQVNGRMLKGRSLLGVCTGRYHTVVYTADAVFTFGLNAGQLGHPKTKGDKRVSQPRQVSSLNHKDISISMVSCSNAATVCLTTKGDIYVLHEYQCRKIASKWQEISKIFVSGGSLDHTDSEALRENGGAELVISLLSNKKVFLWRATSPSLKRAHWAIKRQLFIKDFALTESNLAFVTDQGEGFIGHLSAAKKGPQGKAGQQSNKEISDDFGMLTLMDLLLKDEAEEVQIRRIPNVNRGTRIMADSKGHNFCAIQSLPNCCLTDVPTVSGSEMRRCFHTLLDEADEFDTIHDVVLKVGGRHIPAHKFILLSRSSYFHNLFSDKSSNDEQTDTETVDIPDIHPQIFEQLLLFIYTDNCAMLRLGEKFELLESENEDDNIFKIDLDNSWLDSVGKNQNQSNKKLSAYEVHKKNKKSSKAAAKENEGPYVSSRNPVKLLQDAAKKLGVKGLAKRLDAVKYSKGTIVSSGKHLPQPKLRLDRNRFRDTKLEMYDVSIQSSDGAIFQCHKCVLVARLEYFHSMLASGWLETSSSSALTLPVPGDILEILLDFLYTDESQVVSESANIELLCNILVVADQMLVIRLKEMCEVALANHVTLKNVGELLEFSSVYNASQLKTTCQQFICLNLVTLLEGRFLDVLSDDVLCDLTQYYRESIPNMSRRMITPYYDGPEKSFLEMLISADEEMSSESSNISHETAPKKTGKSKKKRNRNKSTSEDVDKTGSAVRSGRRTSERLSVSSDISVKSEDDLMEIIEGLSVTPSESAVKKAKQLEPKKQNVNNSADQPSLSLSSVPSGSWSHPSMDLTSPKSPPSSAVSFRDIMEQEKHSGDVRTPSSKKSGRFSWKEAKKQQQEMKKVGTEATTKSHSATKGQEVKSTTQTSPPSALPKSACPWASVNKVSQSFRSLMLEESSQSSKGKAPVVTKQIPEAAGKSPTNVVSWGLPTSKVQKSPSMHIDTKTPTPSKSVEEIDSPRSPENPWQMDLAQSPPTPSYSFSDIMKDEIQRRDILVKTSKKPLGLIQMEEQAIQELLEHYKADENVDEYITVERVPQISVTPLWDRHRPPVK